jgi:hypothetical protein
VILYSLFMSLCMCSRNILLINFSHLIEQKYKNYFTIWSAQFPWRGDLKFQLSWAFFFFLFFLFFFKKKTSKCSTNGCNNDIARIYYFKMALFVMVDCVFICVLTKKSAKSDFLVCFCQDLVGAFINNRVVYRLNNYFKCTICQFLPLAGRCLSFKYL